MEFILGPARAKPLIFTDPVIYGSGLVHHLRSFSGYTTQFQNKNVKDKNTLARATVVTPTIIPDVERRLGLASRSAPLLQNTPGGLLYIPLPPVSWAELRRNWRGLVSANLNIIVSIASFDPVELRNLGAHITHTREDENFISAAIELNLAWRGTNLQEIPVGFDPNESFELIQTVGEMSEIPVLVKLPLDTPMLEEVALAAVEAGADALVIGHPPLARTNQSGEWAYLAGPVLRPLTLGAIARVHKVLQKSGVDCPIFASGGYKDEGEQKYFRDVGARGFVLGSTLLIKSSLR